LYWLRHRYWNRRSTYINRCRNWLRDSNWYLLGLNNWIRLRHWYLLENRIRLRHGHLLRRWLRNHANARYLKNTLLASHIGRTRIA
jgi:hypothetical protein